MLKRFTVCFVACAGLAVSACSSGSGSTNAADSPDTFCHLLVAFAAENDSLGTQVASGEPAAARDAMQHIVGEAKVLQKKAPANIKADVDTATEFLVQLDGLMAKYGYDLNKLESDQQASDEFASLNDDTVNVALDQLRTYGERKCGEPVPSGPVDTSGDGGPDSTG